MKLGVILIFLTFFLIFSFLVTLFLYSLILSYLKGSPFSRTKKERIKTILEVCKINSKKILDLGSGDGILIRELAKRGAKATGIEINPLLFLYSKLKIYQEGISSNCKVVFGNFYNYPLKDTDIVLVYLLPETIEKLKPKLLKELKAGAMVISNGFPISGWKPKIKKNNVFFYEIEKEAG